MILRKLYAMYQSGQQAGGEVGMEQAGVEGG